MTNNSSKPDKIYAWPFDDWYRGGCSTKKVVVSGAKDVAYLRATPERELASELVAIARKSLAYHSDEAEYQDKLCCDEGVAYHKSQVKEISAVLAKLEGKE